MSDIEPVTPSHVTEATAKHPDHLSEILAVTATLRRAMGMLAVMFWLASFYSTWLTFKDVEFSEARMRTMSLIDLLSGHGTSSRVFDAHPVGGFAVLCACVAVAVPLILLITGLTGWGLRNKPAWPVLLVVLGVVSLLMCLLIVFNVATSSSPWAVDDSYGAGLPFLAASLVCATAYNRTRSSSLV